MKEDDLTYHLSQVDKGEAGKTKKLYIGNPFEGIVSELEEQETNQEEDYDTQAIDIEEFTRRSFPPTGLQSSTSRKKNDKIVGNDALSSTAQYSGFKMDLCSNVDETSMEMNMDQEAPRRAPPPPPSAIHSTPAQVLQKSIINGNLAEKAQVKSVLLSSPTMSRRLCLHETGRIEVFFENNDYVNPSISKQNQDLQNPLKRAELGQIQGEVIINAETTNQIEPRCEPSSNQFTNDCRVGKYESARANPKVMEYRDNAVSSSDLGFQKTSLLEEKLDIDSCNAFDLCSREEAARLDEDITSLEEINSANSKKSRGRSIEDLELSVLEPLRIIRIEERKRQDLMCEIKRRLSKYNTNNAQNRSGKSNVLINEPWFNGFEDHVNLSGRCAEDDQKREPFPNKLPQRLQLKSVSDRNRGDLTQLNVDPDSAQHVMSFSDWATQSSAHLRSNTSDLNGLHDKLKTIVQPEVSLSHKIQESGGLWSEQERSEVALLSAQVRRLRERLSARALDLQVRPFQGGATVEELLSDAQRFGLSALRKTRRSSFVSAKKS